PAALRVAPAALTLLIVTYMAALVFQLAALVRASAVVVGLAFCAEPVVATAASAILLGERLTLLQFAGGALVVGAVAANVLMENRRSRALATRRALTE
ncbi:MAG: EamA family transporter, partial [Salinarimonas sp.]